MKDNTLKQVTLQSISYVERLLKRFRSYLNGGSEAFSDLEKADLMEILGLEDYELNELLGIQDRRRE